MASRRCISSCSVFEKRNYVQLDSLIGLLANAEYIHRRAFSKRAFVEDRLSAR